MNMKNLNKTDIGLIGLAVMGENLALNMADKGWNVSVYNRGSGSGRRGGGTFCERPRQREKN